jgi:hypothetical protein
LGKGKEMITLRELKEKAVSQQQQKLMGLALAYKRGEVEDSKVSDTVKDLAKSMSTKELEDFASTKHKGLPQKKEDNNISNRSAALKPQTYNDPHTGRKKVRMVPSKSNIVKTNDPEDVKEAHDPKHVKMAIGVASDKRYKQGNYSGAVRAIEKIKKGLSKHPQVAAVLKRQNEAKDPGEYDNEGEMAKTQLKSILRDAEHMIEMFDDEENLPEWVQNKITKAQDYLQSAHSYMMGQDDEDDDDEKEVKEYLEVGTDAIRKSYAAMTPGQNEALAPIDRVAIAGTVALGAKGISKTKKAVGNLAKKVTKLGDNKPKPIASKPKPIVNKPKPIASKPKPDTSDSPTTPNKRPMPSKSNFSNLRKRQQTRAKTKMGSKRTPIRRV